MKKSRQDTEKTERASGDLLWYFLLHNLISVLFFFMFTILMGIYDPLIDIYGFSWIQVIGYLVNQNFWELVLFQIFPVSIISSVLGRITAFFSIRGYYMYADRKAKVKRATKRWGELNKGINRIGIKFFITSLITSFIYAFGMVSILSNAIFNQVTFLPLLIVYSVFKIGVFYFVKWLVGSKL